jgi:hypothetical protein
MRRIRVVILALALSLLALPPAAPTSAATYPPLAVRVAQAGVVTITDAQLARAGWTLPLPRDCVTLSHQGQPLPLADSGISFAFLVLPNESRWTSEAVYWLSVGSSPAPRSSLPSRLPTPLTWEPETLYDRHQATRRGDSWWAGSLASGQPLHAMLVLPEAISSGTPLQLHLRATAARDGHAVAALADGVPIGAVRWDDGSATTLPVTGTLQLPAHAAGALRLDLVLLATGDAPILLDDLVLPTVFPPALPIPGADPVPATPLPADAAGADLLILTHAAFRPALDPLIAAPARLGQRVAVADVQAAYDTFSFGERDPEAIRTLIRQSRPRAVLLVGAGTVALRQDAPARPTFIPPYLIRTVLDGETACDTCYARLNAGEPLAQLLPDLPLGRLVVSTLAEAQAVVAKIAAYLTAPPAGAWQTQALLLSDNDVQPDGTRDPAGSFVATAETAAAALPVGMRAALLLRTRSAELGVIHPRRGDAAL